MLRQIKMRHTDEIVTHDDEVSITTMQANLPVFFSVKHGKRETIQDYRGCLIVRSTVQFTGGKPERLTAVYMYFPSLENRAGTLVLNKNHNLSIRQAKKLIDDVLEASALPR